MLFKTNVKNLYMKIVCKWSAETLYYPSGYYGYVSAVRWIPIDGLRDLQIEDDSFDQFKFVLVNCKRPSVARMKIASKKLCNEIDYSAVCKHLFVRDGRISLKSIRPVEV